MAGNHYRGKAGTIYIRHCPGDDQSYEAWFEDFCIIGTGMSEVEALRDAVSYTDDMNELARNALAKAQGTAQVASGD